MERDVADDAEHDGSGIRDREHVLGVVVVVGRLHEHCARHAGGLELGRDVVHTEVPVEHAGLGTEPGVFGPVEVPDVLVCVDDAAQPSTSRPSTRRGMPVYPSRSSAGSSASGASW
jgi:hypothetical protein